MRDDLDRYFDLNMPRQRVEREGLMRWECIQRLRADHRSGRRDNSYELFAILMFDAWYRRYLRVIAEHVESPGTKAYTRREGALLFPGLRDVRVQPVVTRYDVRSDAGGSCRGGCAGWFRRDWAGSW